MELVKAKKHLGQHFLKDLNIAQKIADILSLKGYNKVIEIGAGMGVLTQFLLKKDVDVHIVEIDKESVAYLETHYPELKGKIIADNFLKYNIADYIGEPFAIIGNFPYNISTQIYPLPPDSVSSPLMPYRVSLPSSPLKRLCPLLPVRVLLP